VSYRSGEAPPQDGRLPERSQVVCQDSRVQFNTSSDARNVHVHPRSKPSLSHPDLGEAILRIKLTSLLIVCPLPSFLLPYSRLTSSSLNTSNSAPTLSKPNQPSTVPPTPPPLHPLTSPCPQPKPDRRRRTPLASRKRGRRRVRDCRSQRLWPTWVRGCTKGLRGTFWL
jgi:hypothetical protein